LGLLNVSGRLSFKGKGMTGKISTEKIRVKQIRGLSGRPQRQRDTLKALGLGRIGKSQELPANSSVIGMVRSVRHLLEVEKVTS